jgi:uncharacterized membrane protein
LLAALGYTAANICLRAVSHCDPVWVSAVKSVPTVVLAAPLLLLRARRGQGVWPHRRALVSLILAALAGQLIGNVVFQWSLGIVGLALAVPVCLVAQIAGSAVLGRIFLQESITPRMAIGVVMLVAASTIFSFSAEDAYRSVTQALWTDAMPRWKLALSVGAVCLSGLSYAWLGLVIRRGPTPDVPIHALYRLHRRNDLARHPESDADRLGRHPSNGDRGPGNDDPGGALQFRGLLFTHEGTAAHVTAVRERTGCISSYAGGDSRRGLVSGGSLAESRNRNRTERRRHTADESHAAQAEHLTVAVSRSNSASLAQPRSNGPDRHGHRVTKPVMGERCETHAVLLTEIVIGFKGCAASDRRAVA